jgi:hypothetical protein
MVDAVAKTARPIPCHLDVLLEIKEIKGSIRKMLANLASRGAAENAKLAWTKA